MGARPPFLAGRDPELACFDELLGQLGAGGTHKHLVFTGLRGVGKTVLLNEFEGRCEAAGWVGEVRELSADSRIGHIVAKSARKALMEMSAGRRAGAALRRALGALKAFALTLGDLTLRFDVDALEGVADSGDLSEDLRDLLVEVGNAARESNSGFALILDELQNLSRPDMAALIVGLHRAKQKNLPVALVGGGLPLLPELTGEAKSYAERGFEFRRLGALDATAAAAALAEPARERGVAWADDAVERVILLTEGYPYFLQEYGRAVWRIGSGESIRLHEVEAAEPIAREYLDQNFFSQRIGKLPTAERAYVEALASCGDGPQRTADVARAMGKSQASVSALRQRLLEAGLIFAPRRSFVDFTVPRCADYVRRLRGDGHPALRDSS
jgi:hypothetical protein